MTPKFNDTIYVVYNDTIYVVSKGMTMLYLKTMHTSVEFLYW